MPVARTAIRPFRAGIAGLLLGLSLAASPLGVARGLPPVDALQSVAADTTPGAAFLMLKGFGASLQADSRHGVPTFLWGADATRALRLQGRSMATKAGLDDEAAARAHLADLADVYRIDSGAIATLPLRNRQRLPNGGAIVRFAGHVDGIDVFREQATVLLGRDGSLVAIGGGPPRP